jgi:O-6-methylguanine DNA methyltransferase
VREGEGGFGVRKCRNCGICRTVAEVERARLKWRASFLPRPASPVADPAAVGAEPKTARNYGALAMELGAGPEAARDVGQAMARNPVALIIPCHRVLAARPAATLAVFPRRAVRRLRFACSSWRAFTSSHRDRLSDLLRSEPGAASTPPPDDTG